MTVTKFPCLTICSFYKRRLFQIFDKFKGLFQETNSKSWGVYFGKERQRKYTNVDVGKERQRKYTNV